ncbi:MAG: threonylcarbamoyl-AMP synthase [Verrucomicrobia subdivision 3 bacterium]|nr:threonylcarbamoyl-AMP synthase [Limisphaerales bacterium]
MKQRLEVLSIDTRDTFDAAVRRAAGLLRAGDVVALPTETVYGLAGNAFNPAAVRRIFEVKGRPPNNPIIVHVASTELARQCASIWPDTAAALAKAFWPGPLTIVLPRSSVIPDFVTAGGPTVGVRWPRHPFMEAVIRECGFPLAAPSANPSNQLSPTNAMHVRKYLGASIPLIVDGGPAQVGIESTVIDLSVTPARLLRPGIIPGESIAAVLGELADATAFGGQLKSPGLLPRHYSPRARLVVHSWRDNAELAAFIAAQRISPQVCHVISHTRIPEPTNYGRVCLIPHDPEAYARALYAELHKCDELGAELIIAEAVPDSPEWRAIQDRLQRASS